LHTLYQDANSRNKLLNLTGFFSSDGGPFLAMLGTPVAGVELILWDSLVEDMWPDQGKRVLRRKREYYQVCEQSEERDAWKNSTSLRGGLCS
jgi:hypothetical protein